MNGLLEAKRMDEDTDEIIEVVEIVVADDDVLRELARRCAALLAEEKADECPPGHWLG